ncbi:MAG: voltage-dependent potassium channel subunit beta [Chloroflexi bacterium]|nr:MAG: voltage-dependent potassium channel subunit beta [Chloroflexota bacterium]
MEYRRLGKSGLKVSELSFGSWVTFGNQVDIDNAVEIMKVAYDGGVNFFDNAEVYAQGKSELVMGAALKKLNWSRDSYIVSSKVLGGAVPNPKPTQRGLSRKHIFEACHQAMERLQVDYLDLYFCHRPDPEVPMEEVVRTMTELIQQGKVFYWGTSEWSAQQLMEAHSVARQYNLIPPTMDQPQYNMFHRDRFEVEYGRLYDTIGLGTTIWSPLASGILTGKYNDGVPDDSRMNLPGYEWLRKMFEGEAWQARLESVRTLTGMAEEMGTTMARLAIAWTLKNPNVSTVILGASRISQLEDNLQALDVVSQLTDDVMEKIEEVLQNKPAPMEFQ